MTISMKLKTQHHGAKRERRVLPTGNVLEMQEGREKRRLKEIERLREAGKMPAQSWVAETGRDRPFLPSPPSSLRPPCGMGRDCKLGKLTSPLQCPAPA